MATVSTVAFVGYTFLAFDADAALASYLGLPFAGRWYAPASATPALSPEQIGFIRRCISSRLDISAAPLRATFPTFKNQLCRRALDKLVMVLPQLGAAKLFAYLATGLAAKGSLVDFFVVTTAGTGTHAAAAIASPHSPVQASSAADMHELPGVEGGRHPGPPGSSPAGAASPTAGGCLTVERGRTRRRRARRLSTSPPSPPVGLRPVNTFSTSPSRDCVPSGAKRPHVGAVGGDSTEQDIPISNTSELAATRWCTSLAGALPPQLPVVDPSSSMLL